MKIHPVGTTFFHGDGQTYMTKLIAANCNFASMPKTSVADDYTVYNPNRGDRASFRNLVFKPTLMQLIAKDNFCVFTPYCFHNRALINFLCEIRVHTNFE
jgi:hypothetical protein